MSTIKFPLKVLKPIKDHLEDKEKKLKKRMKSLSEEDPYADPDRINDNAAADTDADEESGHERITALNREINKGLIRVRKALTRIKLGKFGMCECCGKLIDTDRLAIDPTVGECIKCVNKKSSRSSK